ncbi:MAG: zinc ribbon domain-containing protein [Vicinamibacteria bacterium]|nr:zinc ribbon domain-containing protein [Vicinamibacteria bacterium]
MPLYEYACPSCGTFEVIQKFSDAALTECPKCAAAVEKLLSAPAFHLKGSGWYITDYARKGQSEGQSGESKAPKGEKAAASESKSDAKSESKSESKAESKPAATPAASTTTT